MIPYVQCTKCKRVLSYDSTKGGTSHLRPHTDACNAGASVNNPSIADFFKPSGVSSAAKQQITEKCVQFVCQDIRPFQTVAGEGFKALANVLNMIGVKYGQVAASEILPNPTTISRNIEAKYAEIKQNVVIPQLLKYVNVYGGSVTTDMWTEQSTQTSYITLTVHYINDDWELVCRTLSTSEFDHDLRHTGVNIRKNYCLLQNKMNRPGRAKKSKVINGPGRAEHGPGQAKKNQPVQISSLVVFCHLFSYL